MCGIIMITFQESGTQCKYCFLSFSLIHTVYKHRKLFQNLRRQCLSHTLSKRSARCKLKKKLFISLMAAFCNACVISIWKSDRIIRDKTFTLSFFLSLSACLFASLICNSIKMILKASEYFVVGCICLVIALCHDVYNAPKPNSAKS